MPYTAAREQTDIALHLKGIEINATHSLAYNYFFLNQNLKNFICYVRSSLLFLIFVTSLFADRAKPVCRRLRRRSSAEEIPLRRSDEVSRTAEHLLE